MKILKKLPSFRPSNIIGHYAIANKEELKGSKISEEYEITGIGKKCLKINKGTFLSWDEIDDSLDTLVDGEELSELLTAVLEYFLPLTNNEWEKHLGGRIPLPSELSKDVETEETEEKTDEEEEQKESNDMESEPIDPQLCFLEVGICKQGGEMGYRLNKNIPKEVWYKIRQYFYYDNYNNGGWVCPYSKAKQLEKQLGLQITIENQKEQKKYEAHLERVAKKVEKYSKHVGKTTTEQIEELRKTNNIYYSDLTHKKYIITPENKIYEFNLSDEGVEYAGNTMAEKIMEISKLCEV